MTTTTTTPLDSDPGPLIAELLDENDPEGPVVLKRKSDGSVVAVMAQSVFWKLREGKDGT